MREGGTTRYSSTGCRQFRGFGVDRRNHSQESRRLCMNKQKQALLMSQRQVVRLVSPLPWERVRSMHAAVFATGSATPLRAGVQPSKRRQ